MQVTKVPMLSLTGMEETDELKCNVNPQIEGGIQPWESLGGWVDVWRDGWVGGCVGG